MGELPRDPLSGELARPNILMFDDFEWNGEMTEAQHERYREWLEGLAGERLVVIELGAGTAVPSVRRHSEHLIARGHTRLIRINVREAEVPDGQLGLACGALAALTAIDQMLGFKL